jgi:hypothetical protein
MKRKRGRRLALGLTALMGLTVLTIGCGGAAPTGSGTGQPSISASGTNPGVSPPPPTLGISTTSLPAASTGAAYSASFTATGGTPPYTWSLANGTLPAGVVLGASGQLAGTPASAGSYPFTAKVTDSGAPAQSAAAAFAISVAAISVAVSPTGVVLQTGTQQQFIATVSGAQNTGVLWQVGGISGGNSVVGTITANGTYTAPSTPPTGGSVVVTAISTADNSKSGSAVISVVAQPQPVTVAIVPISASVQAGQTQQFIASVTGTANTSVIWFVNGREGGDPSVGTISPGGLYTAPDSVPANPVVTVTAQSSSDSNISASASALITAPTSTNSGTVYYVDCNAASDSKDGRSPSNAWKTIAHVNPSSFSPGDSILFNKGCTWREQLTVPSSGSAGNVITISSYGSGAAPIISGADLVSSWSAAGNIYNASVAWTPNQVLRSGTPLTKEASLGALTADGQWYYDSGTTTLYVYSISALGTSIEATHRNRAALIDNKSYITLSGLHLTMANQDNLWLETADHCTFSNLELDYAASDGALVSNGSNNLLFDGGSSHNNGHGYGDGDGIGIGQQGAASHDITVQNMDIYSNGYSTQGSAVAVSDTAEGNPPTAIIVQYNKLRDSVDTGLNVSGGTVLAQYNIITGNGFAGIQIIPQGATQVATVSAYGNTIYSNGEYGLVGGSVNSGTGTLTAKNNILLNNNTSANHSEIGWWQPTFITFVTDYNIIYHSIAGLTFFYDGSSNTFTQWKSNTGQDAHSLTSDPKVTNAAAGDFTLQNASPAINAGANLGSTYQMGLDPRSSFSWSTLNQNSYGSGWEIGAFVYLPQ